MPYSQVGNILTPSLFLEAFAYQCDDEQSYIASNHTGEGYAWTDCMGLCPVYYAHINSTNYAAFSYQSVLALLVEIDEAFIRRILDSKGDYSLSPDKSIKALENRLD